PLPAEPVPERAALHIRHGVEEPAAGLTRVEERQDVRMLQAGLGADLPLEPLHAEDFAQSGVQQLERDPPAVPQVAGEIDGGAGAASELTLDDVAAGQLGGERRGQSVAHRAASSASRASVARWNRSAGSRARQRSTKFSNAGGTLSRRLRTLGAGW